MKPEVYIDPATGLPVRCPYCTAPVIWTGQDWFCGQCSYIGAEAVFPERPKQKENYIVHPQPAEQHIELDLDPLSATFLQRLARKWEVSPKDAVVILIKSAAKAEFARGVTNGTHEVRDTRKRPGG